MGERGDDVRRRLLDWALVAARDRGFCVFPVIPGGKTPALKGWEAAATRDPARITAWWRRPFNVGVATGRSGLVVVDLDDAHGAEPPPKWQGVRHGREVLARLAAAAGQQLEDDTYTVSTPRSGSHLYYRAPAGSRWRNSSGTVGWRIDVRARGGYTVAAGMRAEGAYTVVNNGPVAPLPAWLAQVLTPPPRPVMSPVTLAAASTSAYVRAVVEAECRGVTTAATGARHRTLLRAARILGEFVGAAALDVEAARTALRRAADRHVGVDGCTVREVEQAIADGLAYGQRRPRRIEGRRNG